MKKEQAQPQSMPLVGGSYVQSRDGTLQQTVKPTAPAPGKTEAAEVNNALRGAEAIPAKKPQPAPSAE